MMDREELAWAAGFFDGEGHVSWRPTQRHAQFYVHQIHKKTLKRFQSVMGFGVVRGPYENKGGGKHKHSKPIYVFSLSNFEQIQAAIALLWDWLSEPKRRDSKRTLKFAKYWFKTHRPMLSNTRAAREKR